MKMHYSKSPVQCAILLECVSGRKWFELSRDNETAYATDSDFVLFREDSKCMVFHRPHGNDEYAVQWAISRSSDLFDFTGDDLLAMLADLDVQRYLSDDSFITKEDHDPRIGAVHFSSPGWEVVWPFAHRERILAKKIEEEPLPWWRKRWF